MSNLLSKPTTLYVIGNGFDQHHDIQCSYINFRDWMKDNYRDVYNNFLRIYGTCTDDWWSTFEENLTNFNPDIYPNEIAGNTFFKIKKYLEEHYGQDGTDAIDSFEMANPEGVTNHYQLVAAVARFEMQHLKDDLYEAFGDWVKSLTIPDKDKIIKDIDTEAMFLTFNYTKTLEDLYGVDDDHVLHIHGSVDRGDFVIGHNMTAEAMIDRDLEKHALERDPEEDKGGDEARLELFDVIADELKKPVDDLIVENRHYFNSLEGLKKLIVLGFSYSEIDLPYLREIFEVTGEDINVKFGWHTPKDKNNAETFKKAMGLTKCKLVKF